MEITPTESTGTSAPASSSTPASATTPAPAAANAAPAQSAPSSAITSNTTEGDGAPPAATPPAYAPDFKFKAYGEEGEVDEMFRGLIKDADSEKKVKAMFSKAFALDKMSDRYKKTQTDFESYRTQTEPTLKALNNVQRMYDEKDWGGFFGALQIPKEVLYNYVGELLEYEKLTPEQRAEKDRAVQQRQHSYQAQDQFQDLQSRFETLSVQTRTMELNTVLDRPDVKAIAEAFNAAKGPDAFKNLVIQTGARIHKADGKDLTADEAVKQVLDLVGSFVKPLQAPSQGELAPNGTGGKPPVIIPKPPTLPNIEAGSTSPTAVKVKSLDDLKKLAAQMG